jgi:hypothetical protein
VLDPAHDVVDQGLVVREVRVRARATEDLVELLGRQRPRLIFVWMRRRNASSTTVAGIEVRREDDEEVERDLQLLAARHREEVDAAVERHHPSVQQLERRDPLAAEVVDDEEPVVRTHLDRRRVVARRRIELQVEHVDRELAADHEPRAAGSAPSACRPRGRPRPRRARASADRRR